MSIKTPIREEDTEKVFEVLEEILRERLAVGGYLSKEEIDRILKIGRYSLVDLALLVLCDEASRKNFDRVTADMLYRKGLSDRLLDVVQVSVSQYVAIEAGIQLDDLKQPIENRDENELRQRQNDLIRTNRLLRIIGKIIDEG